MVRLFTDRVPRGSLFSNVSGPYGSGREKEGALVSEANTQVSKSPTELATR
jgi:hypothetical protein